MKKAYTMKQIIIAVLAVSAFATSGAFAESNGSGNPNNAGGSDVKITKPPYFIWKDGRLVKNPQAQN